MTVRLLLLPPKVRFERGSNPALEEDALNCRSPGVVSASLMTKGIAGVGVFSRVVWSAIGVMAGAVFEATTEMLTGAEVEISPLLSAALAVNE